MPVFSTTCWLWIWLGNEVRVVPLIYQVTHPFFCLKEYKTRMSVENLVSPTAQHSTEARMRLQRYNMSRCPTHSSFILIGQAVRRTCVAPPPNSSVNVIANKKIFGINRQRCMYTVFSHWLHVLFRQVVPDTIGPDTENNALSVQT